MQIARTHPQVRSTVHTSTASGASRTDGRRTPGHNMKEKSSDHHAGDLGARLHPNISRADWLDRVTGRIAAALAVSVIGWALLFGISQAVRSAAMLPAAGGAW